MLSIFPSQEIFVLVKLEAHQILIQKSHLCLQK